jgi:uncharacterized protein DUF955
MRSIGIKPRVSFIPKKTIEREALLLIDEYAQSESQSGAAVVYPPVPYEDIIERHLELVLDYPDLCRELGGSDVLGATYIDERMIAIDNRLTDDPRFSFTCAHEIGHWILHRHIFAEDPGQMLLFGEKAPSIVCRDGQKDKPIEKQADIFSAYLLMPGRQFCGRFQELKAKLGLRCDRSIWMASDEAKYQAVVSELASASVFNTSKESVKNRIRELNLVFDGPDLFENL